MRVIFSMPSAPALEHAREAAGLALQMEAQATGWCMCSKVLRASLRTACRRDLGEHAFAQLHQQAHGNARKPVKKRGQYRAPASQAQVCPGGRLPPAMATSASVAHLNANGMATVTIFASSMSRRETRTVACKSGLSAGHTVGGDAGQDAPLARGAGGAGARGLLLLAARRAAARAGEVSLHGLALLPAPVIVDPPSACGDAAPQRQQPSRARSHALARRLRASGVADAAGKAAGRA